MKAEAVFKALRMALMVAVVCGVGIVNPARAQSSGLDEAKLKANLEGGRAELPIEGIRRQFVDQLLCIEKGLLEGVRLFFGLFSFWELSAWELRVGCTSASLLQFGR